MRGFHWGKVEVGKDPRVFYANPRKVITFGHPSIGHVAKFNLFLGTQVPQHPAVHHDDGAINLTQELIEHGRGVPLNHLGGGPGSGLLD